MLYYITACITFISATLGACFAVQSATAQNGAGRTNALYMFARSLALSGIAFIPFCLQAPAILEIITVAMLLVQLADVIIGIFIKSRLRAAGPLFMAACHGICLFLMHF